MNSDNKLSVLIIEDEVMLNDAYTKILETEGIEVHRAYNGAEALENVRKIMPDIVLLDLRMPKMDGITFLKKLDVRKSLPGTKIIVFSNYDDQKEIDRAFELGAVRYMLKAWASPKDLAVLVKETAQGINSQDTPKS